MARRTRLTGAINVIGETPLASTDAVAAQVAEAHADGTTLRIVGQGHWLDAGRPCHADGVLDLGSVHGIIEYEPGDLTLTAFAGTTLDEISRATAREGQWLTLDPAGSGDGTLGATIATASAGSLASSCGTPRDLLLGCALVTGAGAVVRAGGRVVKNVAGFDLARLMTGAWGTLGALTEITVRLRARPEVDRTLAIEMDSTSHDACSAAWRWLRASAYTPLAAEMCSAGLAARLGLGDVPVLLVRFGGNEALVVAAERSIAELGDARVLANAEVWDRLREAEPAGAVVLRLGTTPASVGRMWNSAASIAQRAGGYAHATLERGVVRCVVPVSRMEEENGKLRGIIGELQSSGSRVVERLPDSLWSDIGSAVGDPLSVGIRRAFDPTGTLNPGILGKLS